MEQREYNFACFPKAELSSAHQALRDPCSPHIFCHVCTVKDDLTGSHQSCDPFCSWVSLNTTLKRAQAPAMRALEQTLCDRSSFLPWPTTENSQHKIYLGWLV